MQRYFLNEINNYITGNDYHHIKNVMRMGAGDFIIVCCNNSCYKVEIVSITDKIEYKIVDTLKNKKQADITIIQGLPKNNKIDTFIKYSTCFGASKIILVNMIRSISKVSNIDNKVSRYHAIAKEAAELSHRSFIPPIIMTDSIKKIDLGEFDIVLLADENEKTTKIENLSNLKDKRIAVIIGPEGGIDDKEREYLKKIAISISLGVNILPTEVANLYALSLLKSKME
ncbi:16S rRNA (uracil(1498)-N(3))-methyltransferase [Acholeplasma sp. OttesenSCG-928-E16]|nr:16S rRNA (uracil(1498)-N(3))-methyltransferase [Acholeplasma sp. OttesenSCG-928-E16]